MNDPLVKLWQTALKPDTHHLLQDLQRFKHKHQQMKRSVFAILSAVSMLLIVAEVTGHIATRGALSVIWILGLMIGMMWQRRVRCNRIDALSLDTVSLLKIMLSKAQTDLFLARCLYAGVPGGALVGTFVTKIMQNGVSSAPVGNHPEVQRILTGAGAAILLVMVVTGIVLARSRWLQVRMLSEKLRSVEAEL